MQAAASAPTCPLTMGAPYTRAFGWIGSNERRPVSTRLVDARSPASRSISVIERYGLWPIEYTLFLKNRSRIVEFAGHDELVDRRRVHRELLDGVPQVPRQRPHQELAGMLAVVVDARHDLGAAEALRVLERRVGDELARLEIEQPEDDRRGAEIHREPVERARPAIDLDAVEQDAIPVARRPRRSRERARPAVGSPNACRSMRMRPRRIVWHSIGPAPTTRAWHDRRKGGFRCRSCQLGADKSAPPAVTSTMHSLHLPWERQDVGTATCIPPAASKSDVPGGTAACVPLMVTVSTEQRPMANG